ncbi:hypothetical protein FOC1_g10002464, partial [Fusarium oxysporum f. sp. cubense race 1]
YIVILCRVSQVDGYAFCLGLPLLIDLYESSLVISAVEYLIRGLICRLKYSHTALGSVILRIRLLDKLTDIYQAY